MPRRGDYTVTIKLAPHEYNALRAAAQLAGLTTCSHTRAIVLGTLPEAGVSPADFVRECCRVLAPGDGGCWETASFLYNSYRAILSASGLVPVSLAMFGTILGNLGVRKSRRGYGNVYALQLTKETEKIVAKLWPKDQDGAKSWWDQPQFQEQS
jgi:hypothetical protein